MTASELPEDFLAALGARAWTDAWSLQVTLSSVPMDHWFYKRTRLKGEDLRLFLRMPSNGDWLVQLERHDGLFRVQWRPVGLLYVDSETMKFRRMVRWPALASHRDFPRLVAGIEAALQVKFIRHADVAGGGTSLGQAGFDAGALEAWLAPCADTWGTTMRPDSEKRAEDRPMRNGVLVKLLVHAPGVMDARSGTWFGGRPLVPAGGQFPWPVCNCGSNMQYLGRIALLPDTAAEPRHVLLFMCQNEPGSCSEWDADGGGNCGIIVTGALAESLAVPATGLTLRETAYGASIEQTELGEFAASPYEDYDAARLAWGKANGRGAREVLGQIGGSPLWIQSPEVPACQACGAPMRFLAQLEEGPDHRTAMNFGGGGSAYVFDCGCGSTSAKLLWQCG